MKELALHEKTWLAAAIDGEGSMQLSLYKDKRKKGDNVCIEQKLLVTNTHPGFCKRCLDVTGVGYVLPRSPHGNSKWKPTFDWILIKQTDLRDILEAVLPYLIIKKEHAEILLAYLELRRNNAFRGGKRRMRTKEEFELVEKLRTTINSPRPMKRPDLVEEVKSWA